MNLKNKLLIKKVDYYLVNYIVVVTMSLKNKYMCLVKFVV